MTRLAQNLLDGQGSAQMTRNQPEHGQLLVAESFVPVCSEDRQVHARMLAWPVAGSGGAKPGHLELAKEIVVEQRTAEFLRGDELVIGIDSVLTTEDVEQVD